MWRVFSLQNLAALVTIWTAVAVVLGVFVALDFFSKVVEANVKSQTEAEVNAEVEWAHPSTVDSDLNADLEEGLTAADVTPPSSLLSFRIETIILLSDDPNPVLALECCPIKPGLGRWLLDEFPTGVPGYAWTIASLLQHSVEKRQETILEFQRVGWRAGATMSVWNESDVRVDKASILSACDSTWKAEASGQSPDSFAIGRRPPTESLLFHAESESFEDERDAFAEATCLQEATVYAPQEGERVIAIPRTLLWLLIGGAAIISLAGIAVEYQRSRERTDTSQ